ILARRGVTAASGDSFIFRAARASALDGWTIQEIVFECQRTVLHRLDKLSCVPVPKWHNRAGVHFPGLRHLRTWPKRRPQAGTTALVSPHGSAIEAEVPPRY